MFFIIWLADCGFGIVTGFEDLMFFVIFCYDMVFDTGHVIIIACSNYSK